mmetsp:Transcript_118507/g.221409  ORF Transcript_118507/g.221409 Transcript_118507/m.221409 type:complete len:132 (-) Transcript_118507:196-591(-)
MYARYNPASLPMLVGILHNGSGSTVQVRQKTCGDVSFVNHWKRRKEAPLEAGRILSVTVGLGTTITAWVPASHGTALEAMTSAAPPGQHPLPSQQALTFAAWPVQGTEKTGNRLPGDRAAPGDIVGLLVVR